MSIFKESFNEEIVKTLSTRQEIMGKQTRTPQELSFLNSNTSWASLKSAIDVNDDKGNLAKNNVLEGGSLINGKLRYGVSATGSYSFQNSLGESNELGIRPMPGITSVTIENIGAYGSTRRATINYQCWDVKQLDIFEQLYMRPGYLVLLEFGRTTYLEKDSNGISKLKQNTPQYDFFAQQNINLLDELKKLYDESIKSKGNYDAFLGYVVNYGWQIRPDGGYDCKTEVISTGEVLESLKTNYSLSPGISFKGLDNDNPTFKGLLFPSFPQTTLMVDDIKKLSTDYSSNILLGLIREVYLLGLYKNLNKLQPSPTLPGVFSVNVNNKTIDLNLAYSRYESGRPEYTKLMNGSKNNYYITLESLCNLINEVIIPQANNSDNNKLGALAQISVYDREYLNNPSGSLLNCLYNSLMTSVDPDVCLIKNENWINILKHLDVSVDLKPITPVPKGYESILNLQEAKDLKNKMVGWIKLIGNQNSIKTPSFYFDQILMNIDSDRKNDLNKNKSDAEYFQLFQQVYQSVRGGINPGYKIPKQITLPTGQILLSETKFKTVSSTRSWTYFQNEKNDIFVKTLRSRFPLNNDINFIDLFNSYDIYGNIIKLSSTYYVPKTENNAKIYQQLQKKYNDAKLDELLNNEQNIANNAIQTVKKAEEIKKSITEVGNNYEIFLTTLHKDFIIKKDKFNFGQIGNIYINLKHLYYLADDPNLKTQDPQGKNSLVLSQFITHLMKEVQSSIGNVNNFELHIDDKDGIGRIIDLNYVNKNKHNFTFELGTNKSIIRDLQLESKIFSDQVSMIAISAQGDSGRLGLDNSTLVAFNKGTTDRLIPKKDSPLVINQTDEINNLISSLSGLTSEFFNPYMKGFLKDDCKYNSSLSTNFKDYLRDVIMYFTGKLNPDNKQSMFLPIKLSFTLDGISGLVIGNLFSINKDFIPKSYKTNTNDLGYLITKVGHQIQNNDWVTTIEALPQPPENTLDIVNPTQFSLVIIYEPSSGTVVSGVVTSNFVSSATQNSIISKIYDKFKQYYKLTKEQTAGIIGNAIAESNLNFTIDRPDPNKFNPSARSGGLFQWNDKRFDALKSAYPNDTWRDSINGPENQLNFLIKELNKDYKGMMDRIKILSGDANTVISKSAFIWASEFERCVTCNNPSSDEIKKRINYSKDVLSKLK
jgi:hypothetical protein